MPHCEATASTPGGATSSGWSRSRRLLIACGVVALAVVGAGICTYLIASSSSHKATSEPERPTQRTAPLRAIPAPADLPNIDYGPPPKGFPQDINATSAQRLTLGLHPLRRIAAYDAPGGQPLAFLPPDIRGAELTMPIVGAHSGWVSVVLPSTNRTMAWVPPGSWASVPLRDQLIVVRDTHQMMWLRDGALVKSWRVSLGLPSSPTPLGRTFVLGRSSLEGKVYAGTDVLALGAVPDNPNAVPTGLRGAHTGIHTWYHDRELGKNTTDGCIRLTKAGQQLLLAEIQPGTPVVVVDSATQVTPSADPPLTFRPFI